MVEKEKCPECKEKTLEVTFPKDSCGFSETKEECKKCGYLFWS